jgi:GTP-binding protein HflX
MVLEILRKEKNSYAFSARTGFGIEGLVHAIEKSLPQPSVEINSVIPYDRGDLINAIHETGEIITENYLEEGTEIHARVNESLAKAIDSVRSGAK